jgi:hypothetical protein
MTIMKDLEKLYYEGRKTSVLSWRRCSGTREEWNKEGIYTAFSAETYIKIASGNSLPCVESHIFRIRRHHSSKATIQN